MTPLNQIEIDVAEFVLDNWVELKKDCTPTMEYEWFKNKFGSATANECYKDATISNIKNKVQESFNLDGETIELIFTEEYINMVLTKEFFVYAG